MDRRSKKLILRTMQMNNANQIKLKYTVTKIINLELFSSVCITVKLYLFKER